MQSAVLYGTRLDTHIIMSRTLVGNNINRLEKTKLFLSLTAKKLTDLYLRYD